MLAVMFSPILLLWLPSRLGYVYLVTGVAGILRAVPYLAQSDWRTLAAVGVVSGVMALHLLTAQGLHASAFLPELLALGRFSGDHYLHAAIASMIRYNGVASAGLDGTVPFDYHVGSHYWFAALGSIADSSSAYAYLVGRTVFMLPSLYLALFMAALCLRRSRPYDAPFLVVATTTMLILIDGAKLDRYTYRSESEVFGIMVLLLALPLLEDAVIGSERSIRAWWPRLIPWPFVVLLAGWIKLSVGVLLGIVVCYALARIMRRSPFAVAVMVAVASGVAMSFRGLGGGMGEFLLLRPLGFLLSGYDLAALSVVFAYGLAAAVVLPWLWGCWARDPGRPSFSFFHGALSWEELIVVIATSAAVPVLLVTHFAGWYFVDAVLWFTLAVILARLSRVDVMDLWRSIRLVKCGSMVLGVVLVMSAVPVVKAFSPGDIVGATREMRSGLVKDGTLPGDRVVSLRAFGQSLVRHRVLFDPEFVEALRRSYGVRAIELIRAVSDREGRSGLGVFVVPENARFWTYSVDCRSQPLFVPALAGIPMMRGLPPVTEPCPLPRTYGYADYGASSRAVDADPGELCRHARSRAIRRVLVLRDIEVTGANTLLRCDGAGTWSAEPVTG